jgi:hypothetical protein
MEVIPETRRAHLLVVIYIQFYSCLFQKDKLDLCM